ncbi:MAG: hypothetical protein KC502_22080 [Myxococcales bacterium]|nr:hypothetical protein [Myxococcales bacterium]
MKPTALIALTLSLQLLHAGCMSTAYQPKTRAYLAQVVDSGQPAYLRDGRAYPGGLLGSGLIEATRGVPAANAYAVESRDSAVMFLVTYLGGFLMLAGGAGFAAANAVDERNGIGVRQSSTASSILGPSLIAGGILSISASIWAAMNMQVRRLDAINAYNDIRWQQELQRVRGRSLPRSPLPSATPAAVPAPDSVGPPPAQASTEGKAAAAPSSPGATRPPAAPAPDPKHK